MPLNSPSHENVRGKDYYSAPAQIINTYQPAGEIEEFFEVLAKFKDLPTREQAINKTYTDEQINEMKRLFEVHGMVLTGPPLIP